MGDNEFEAGGSCSSLPITGSVSLDKPSSLPEPWFPFSLNGENNNIMVTYFTNKCHIYVKCFVA